MVLLFGSETWNLTQRTMKRLKSFHIMAAWQMGCTNTLRKSLDVEWTFPSSDEVLEEVWMRTIAEYITMRRQTITASIGNRPIILSSRQVSRDMGIAPVNSGGSNRWTLMPQDHWPIMSRVSIKGQSRRRSCKWRVVAVMRISEGVKTSGWDIWTFF